MCGVYFFCTVNKEQKPIEFIAIRGKIKIQFRPDVTDTLDFTLAHIYIYIFYFPFLSVFLMLLSRLLIIQLQPQAYGDWATFNLASVLQLSTKVLRKAVSLVEKMRKMRIQMKMYSIRRERMS